MPVLNIDSQTTVTNVATQRLDVTFSGTRLNILTVAGPMGPPGHDGTGGSILNLTGLFPIFYDQGSGVVGIASGYYARFGDLTGASGALQAQIVAASAGVISLNGLSGILTLAGTGSLFVTAQGQRLTISGSGFASLSDIAALSGWTSSTFATQASLAATGQGLYGLFTGGSGQGVIDYATKTSLTQTGAALSAVKVSGSAIIPIADFSGIGGTLILYSNGKVLVSGAGSAAVDHGDGINLSGQLQTTGSYLYGLTTGASGYIIGLISAASAGVSSLNAASGVLVLQGAGNVTVSTVGQTITVSGNTGDYALFAQKIDLTATGAALQNRINLISGLLTGASGQAATDYATKIALTQTGATLQGRIDLLSGNLIQTGVQLMAITTGMSGQGVIDYATKAVLTQTGIQLQTIITSSGSALYRLLTGESGQNVTDYALKTSLTATGALLSAVKVSGSSIIPVANFSGIGGTLVIWSGNLILISGAAGGAGGVTQGQLDALSGFSTGTFATITNLELTGSNLQAQIRALTGLGTSLAFDFGRNIVIPSGTGSLPVTFSRDLGAVPLVIPMLSNNSGDPTLACYPSGATSAGFTLVFSATVPTSGYRLSYLATTGSGYVVLGQSTGSSAISQVQLDLLSGYVVNTGNSLQAQIISGYADGIFSQRTLTVTANYAIVGNETRLYCNNTIPITLTFPSAVAISGYIGRIKLINTGVVYLTGTAPQTFDGSPAYNLLGQYSVHEVHSNGTNWFIW